MNIMVKLKYFPIEGVRSILTLTMLFKERSERQHQIQLQLQPKVDGQHRHHQPMKGKYSKSSFDANCRRHKIRVRRGLPVVDRFQM